MGLPMAVVGLGRSSNRERDWNIEERRGEERRGEERRRRGGGVCAMRGGEREREVVCAMRGSREEQSRAERANQADREAERQR